VLSIDPEIDPDIPAMIGASAALSLSGIPFKGPIGAARVGYLDGEYVINPTATQLKTSKLNLVVAGTERAVLMVESEADQLSEEVMLGAVMHGHSQMQAAINAIHELVRDAGKPAWDWQAAAHNEPLLAKLVHVAGPGLREAYQTRNKQARTHKINDVYTQVWRSSRKKRPRAARRSPTTTRSMRSSSTCRPRSCAARSSKASRASMDATRVPCAPSRFVSACCRVPRLGALHARRDAALVTATLGTKQDEQFVDALQANTATASCSTTTCRLSPPERPGASVRRSVARSATDGWPSARCWRAAEL